MITEEVKETSKLVQELARNLAFECDEYKEHFLKVLRRQIGDIEEVITIVEINSQ